MKIGIVTIPDYTNFGNRLQNYALSYTLQIRFGCKVESLAAIEDKAFYNGNYIAWLKDQIAKSCCFNPVFAEKKWGPNITRWANFQNWSKRYIPTRNFYEYKCLAESLNSEYDMFFAGSDQIWNYHFSSSKFDDYFLKFAKKDKRAAICASFGVEEIPEDWKSIYADGLSGFSHLSVREDAGARIVKALTGQDVPVLVDPVLLLSPQQWRKVSKKPRVDLSQPYVLKYYLGEEAEEEKIDTWAKANGYRVYELMNDQIPDLYSAGPGEFLSLIEHASLVVSDSFHCIAFSILFRRPFIVYARRGNGNDMTSRLDTLLGKFHFQHRWKHLLAPVEYLTCDYSETSAILAAEQEQALGYIQSVLDAGKKRRHSHADSC